MQEVVVRGEPFCMLALFPEGNVCAISINEYLNTKILLSCDFVLISDLN